MKMHVKNNNFTVKTLVQGGKVDLLLWLLLIRTFSDYLNKNGYCFLQARKKRLTKGEGYKGTTKVCSPNETVFIATSQVLEGEHRFLLR